MSVGLAGVWNRAVPTRTLMDMCSRPLVTGRRRGRPIGLLILSVAVSMLRPAPSIAGPQDAVKQRVQVDVLPRQQVIRGLGSTAEPGFDLRAIRTAVVPRSVLDLVARLDDDDWATREAATRDLHAHEAPDEALLKVLDQESTLGEEQRQRLLAVVTRRIRERERGAIGIRMTPIGGFGDVLRGGIEVTEVIPGLPAERVLRPGDVIVRIDEKEIARNEDLISHVQRLTPGDVISVRILRPRPVAADKPPEPDWVAASGDRWYEPIDVEFALGSFDMLGENQRSLNPETQRRERLVIEMRTRWDLVGTSLDGQGTIDGVVPPENARPPGAIRRFSP